MNEIIEYVKERKRHRDQKVGVLVAQSNANKINIGWSKVTLSKGGKRVDNFDKDLGVTIARGRIGKEIILKSQVIPHVIRKQIPKFQERCLKYFKGQTF